MVAPSPLFDEKSDSLEEAHRREVHHLTELVANTGGEETKEIDVGLLGYWEKEGPNWPVPIRAQTAPCLSSRALDSNLDI